MSINSVLDTNGNIVNTNTWPDNSITFPYTLGSSITYNDIEIRKVTNGFIIKFNNKEMVYESLDNLLNEIKQFYTEKK